MKPKYDLAGKVIGLAMQVHSTLGAGFVESVYENALCVELSTAQLDYERQKSLKVLYKQKIRLFLGQCIYV